MHVAIAYEYIIMSAATSSDQGGDVEGWGGQVGPGRLEMRGGLSGLHELFRLVRPKWIWRPTRPTRPARSLEGLCHEGRPLKPTKNSELSFRGLLGLQVPNHWRFLG